MRKYKEWKETVDAAAPNEVQPSASAFDGVHIGPQNRLASGVRTASARFDKNAGDAVGNMSVNQKLHFIADSLIGMTGDSPEAGEIRKDRQLLSKLRQVIIKIDNALKAHVQ